MPYPQGTLTGVFTASDCRWSSMASSPPTWHEAIQGKRASAKARGRLGWGDEAQSIKGLGMQEKTEGPERALHLG